MDTRSAREAARRVAGRQAGRITRAQLHHLGVSDDQVRRWVEGAYLTPKLPKVFAVGHAAPSRAADLWAAVLYAGPNAALSHATAAHWRGLIDYPPAAIEVSTSRRIRSLDRIRVYGRRPVERCRHNGLPVTSIAQTMLDLAAVSKPLLVRKALARLDYRHQLDVGALEAICGNGKPGSALLLEALRLHQPRLARTFSPLEDDFLAWCERWSVPLPQVNVRVHGVLVDAYWAERGVVVELDGAENHSSPAQLRRDRANELVLRGHGLVVVRYDWALLHQQPRLMYEDLMAILSSGRAH